MPLFRVDPGGAVYKGLLFYGKLAKHFNLAWVLVADLSSDEDEALKTRQKTWQKNFIFDIANTIYKGWIVKYKQDYSITDLGAVHEELNREYRAMVSKEPHKSYTPSDGDLNQFGYFIGNRTTSYIHANQR